MLQIFNNFYFYDFNQHSVNFTPKYIKLYIINNNELYIIDNNTLYC